MNKTIATIIAGVAVFAASAQTADAARVIGYTGGYDYSETYDRPNLVGVVFAEHALPQYRSDRPAKVSGNDEVQRLSERLLAIDVPEFLRMVSRAGIRF